MKKFIVLFCGLVILTISSCAPKPGTPESALVIRKDQIEKTEKKVEKTVDSIPKWCLNPPISDYALSACGTGESANMNMARNRAILDAKRQLADSIDSEISSRMEDFLKSTGMSSNEQVKQASEIITKNTTIQAKLIGYKQTKTDAVSMDGKYQFYVLIEYPVGDANKALLNQIKQDDVLSTQKDADKAMAELEAEIEKRKKK
jgi:hypothetical protein